MASDSASLRVEVLLSAQRALWDIPTPALRAVAVAWDEQWLRPRFVYDAPPTEDERELVILFGSYHAADFVSHKVNERYEVLPWPLPLNVQPDEVWVYRRYEPDRE